jgi:glycosyltransferase involved in cell wall biosynthesis
VVDISILTPSLNYGRFIGDTLLSTRGQQNRHLSVEHIVQDGSSADETVQILTSFEGEVDWSSDPDQGQSDALNKALTRASGRWIGWLNADEFFMPGSLAHLVRVGERTQSDVVYGDCVIIDEGGRLVRLQAPHRFSSRLLTEYGCFISSCSTIFRRSVLGETPWDVEVRRVMDWDLYMRLMARGATFRHVSYPVGAFRLHPDQVTASPRERWEEERRYLAARYGRPTDDVERWRRHVKARRWHRIRKSIEGSHLREMRARALRGRDMRWFGSAEGLHNAAGLLRRCYGRESVEPIRQP